MLQMRLPPLRVVLVAQTPPPYHGQAIMMKLVKDGPFRGVEIFHVRMHFSRELSEGRRLSARKFLHLGGVLMRVFALRFMRHATVLYYPPSGPTLVPLLRDIAILSSTRWMFKVTIFHFQAGGLSEAQARLPALARPLFRLAFGRPEVAIELSESSPRDGAAIDAKQVLVVANGCPDEVAAQDGTVASPPKRRLNAPPEILFVGALRESKGVLDLMRSCAIIREQGGDFRLRLMGSFVSESFQQRVMQMAIDLSLLDVIDILGVRTGREKFAEFERAAVLCLPSFFDSESMPVCIVEAMMHSLPVVATHWRGIPSLVRDGESGYLVRVGDVGALADRIRLLLEHSEVAERMGRNGRRLFEDHYTVSKFYENLQAVFDSVRTT